MLKQLSNISADETQRPSFYPPICFLVAIFPFKAKMPESGAKKE